MRTATFIKTLGNPWKGDARLYHLSEPVVYDDDYETDPETEYVVVSGVWAWSDNETYIFPATSTGEALSFTELDGSFTGGIDHERALRDLGYYVGIDRTDGEPGTDGYISLTGAVTEINASW